MYITIKCIKSLQWRLLCMQIITKYIFFKKNNNETNTKINNFRNLILHMWMTFSLRECNAFQSFWSRDILYRQQKTWHRKWRSQLDRIWLRKSSGWFRSLWNSNKCLIFLHISINSWKRLQSSLDSWCYALWSWSSTSLYFHDKQPLLSFINLFSCTYRYKTSV